MRVRGLWLAGLAAMLAQAAWAEGFWLPTGDRGLRDDITLLVDEGVIRLPVTTWPLPVADVRAAVARVDADTIASESLRSTLLRLQARVAVRPDAEDWLIRQVSATGGQEGLLRDYGALGRDHGEIRSVGGTANDRWDMTIAAERQFDPVDGHQWRFDGSDLTIRWGNWLFSANTMDRWYGPGEEGSLILSNNARPMPQISLDRMQSTRPSIPILSWIGPWRFTAFFAIGESRRPDLSNPRFMGQRFTFQPLPILEFGISRTAQYCGQIEQGPGFPPQTGTRPACNLKQWQRALLGNDNTGINGISFYDQPGNQMAGFDARLTSPIQALPVAIYGQLIGEDVTHTAFVPLPSKFLGLLGGETWAQLQSGGVFRAHVEYSNTTCKFAEPSTITGACAYRNDLFFAGYRYDYRNIAYTTDANSEFWIADASLTQGDGTRWGVKLRHGTLDKNLGGLDPYSPVTVGMSHYDSGEVYWSGHVLGQDISAQLGLEHQDPVDPARGQGIYGFLQWRKTL